MQTTGSYLCFLQQVKSSTNDKCCTPCCIRLCQGVLCYLNVVHFHVTRMNVIMGTTMENMTFLAPLYANLTNGKQHYDPVSRKLAKSESRREKKPINSFTPLNKLWFSRNSQSLKVCAHLLTGSLTNRKKKCRKKLKNEFRCTEFYSNRTKIIENTGKSIIMHVTEVWSPLSRFLRIP
jgi:hypothetical protein